MTGVQPADTVAASNHATQGAEHAAKTPSAALTVAVAVIAEAAAQVDATPAISLAVEQVIKKPIDRFTVVAFFALYNLLPEGTRFGIHNHQMICQYSFEVRLPYSDRVLFNVQSVARKINGDSRNQAVDFKRAILDALLWYSRSPAFLKMLPHAQAGLLKYAKSYGEEDNATSTLELAANRIELQIKASQKSVNSLITSADDQRVYENWSEDDLNKVASDILLCNKKKEEKKDFQADVDALLLYLQKKREQIAPLL